jgi:hypothetical protein
MSGLSGNVHPWSRVFLPVALFCLACASQPLPSPPAPRQLELRAPPSVVLDSAAAALLRLGWKITETSRTTGTLRAEHEGEGDVNGDWMVCENGVGRKGDTRRATRDLRSTVTVRLQATPATQGSAIRISAGVLRAYSIFLPADRTIDAYVVTQCVSTGAIESWLAGALVAALGASIPGASR